MAEGRVIVFKEDRTDLSRRFGYILVDEHSDRKHTAYFDERDIDCDLAEIEPPVTRVTFDYGEQVPGRNPRARNVRLIPLPEKLGTVKAIKIRAEGFYGFIVADDDHSQDYYFHDRSVVSLREPLKVGDRVRFRHDAAGDRPRARYVELMEED